MQKPSIPSHFEIKVGIQGVGAFLKKDVKKGEVLFKMQGAVIDHPTRTSVQVGSKEHIEDALAGHINHSCNPNAKVVRETREFVSLRDIQKGEEIVFNYNDNEDSLSSPFVCVCCGKKIAGKMSISV